MQSAIITSIVDNVLLPVLLVVGSTVLLVVKSYVNKITKSIIAKNELDALERTNSVNNHLINEISVIVESAVASNMQLAESMKEGSENGLSDDQIKELNESTMRLINNALPPSLLDVDSPLLEIIGGRERLNSIIKNMIEQYVYEYKVKRSRSK